MMKSRQIGILFTAIVAAIMIFTFSSCRTVETEPEAEIEAEESSVEEIVEETEEENMVQETEETGDQESAEEVVIPEEISLGIEEAQGLFDEGLYAEASKAFRNAQIDIEESGLPDNMKQELLSGIEDDYNTAKSIVDEAMMHHSSAMTLIYEKRYEEAEIELNAALEIYPKYQTAIDALESLEDIRGVQ